MIGLKKTPMERSVKRKKVVFRHFAVWTNGGDTTPLGGVGSENTTLYENGTLYAKRSKNCDFSGNRLQQSAKAEIFKTSAGNTVNNIPINKVTKVFCVRMPGENGTSVFERYLFALNTGYVQLYDEQTKALTAKTMVGKNVRGALVRAANGTQAYLINGATKGSFLKSNEEFYPSVRATMTNALCLCKNRLFVFCRDGKLVYSDPMDPLDLAASIDNGGYVTLPLALGNPIALTSVEEYVYVFFKCSIMRLRVKGSARNFCLEELSYTGGKIIGGSACAVDDGIIFLAQDGLWKVQGREVKRFCKAFTPYPYAQDNDCNAAVCESKYFLRYPTENGDFLSVAVDLDGQTWSYCHDLIALSAGFDTPVFVRKGMLYQLGGTDLPDEEVSVFESMDTDFGMRGKKTLCGLELLGEGNVKVKIYYDGRVVQRDVAFLDGKAVLEVGVRGEAFSFAFEIGRCSVLHGLSAEIEG